MTSLHEMLPKAKNLVYDLERRVTELEYHRGHLSDAAIMLQELSTLLQLCDSLVAQERRDQQAQWRAKLDELSRQRDFLDTSLSKFRGAKGVEMQQERDREKLLRRRQAMPDFMVDAYAEEGASVGRSRGVMKGVMETASGTLGMLREQRETLKHAQRLGFDIMNRLGVSQSIMRAVERRDTQDRILVFGGMALTLIILYLTISYSSSSSASDPGAPSAAHAGSGANFDLARE